MGLLPGATQVFMQSYLGPPWTDLSKIWCVRVFIMFYWNMVMKCWNAKMKIWWRHTSVLHSHHSAEQRPDTLNYTVLRRQGSNMSLSWYRIKSAPLPPSYNHLPVLALLLASCGFSPGLVSERACSWIFITVNWLPWLHVCASKLFFHL